MLHATTGSKEEARKDSSLRPAERDEPADTLILDYKPSKLSEKKICSFKLPS